MKTPSSLLFALAIALYVTLVSSSDQYQNPDDAVLEGRIKVWLYAYPAYFKGVMVDAYKDACISLDNNLYVWE